MLTPTILSMGLRRAPGMIQGAARGLAQAPGTMRDYIMQSQKPKSVAEILSEPLGEMTPNLGRATSAASRQREIADMLLQGAEQQDNTSIAGGLSQLGQAFLARRAGQKADMAEDKQREMASLLMQQAMQGGEGGKAAVAQLLAGNQEYGLPAAIAANAPPPPKEYGFQNVDGALVRTDPGEGTATELIAARPKPVDLPEGMYINESGARVYDPAYLEGQMRMRSAGASNNNFNLPSTRGETEFQKGLGTNAANNFQTIVDQGRAAGASIGNLDTMETLLDSIDYTGFGGDTLLQVQRAGALLGMEIPDLPAKEAAKRLSSQMALSLKTDLPGPMSNADREFLLSIPPNLNSTAAGNDAILFILRKREEHKQNMMQSLLQANVQSMEQYRDWENQYLQTTPPMFTPATQASLLKALGVTGQ